jgi:hypothetical protein
VIEIVLFSKDDGPLTKRISLGPNGKIVSDGSQCIMASGTARRIVLSSLREFADLIGSLGMNQAIALGALAADLPDEVRIVPKHKLNGGAAGIIARTQNFISFRPGQPALMLLDFDIKGQPPQVRQRLAEFGGFWPALVSVLPELTTVARIERASTSAGLFRTDTGNGFPGSGGAHVYLLVKDGTDIPRFLKALHERCWLAGLGWTMVGTAGQLLERSVVDYLVGTPERLVFEGPPVLDWPLAQDLERRRSIVYEAGGRV